MDADHVGIIHGSLTRLFENAKFLDDVAFIAFATALCRLSAEASGLPIGEEETSSTNKSARAVSQMDLTMISMITNLGILENIQQDILCSGEVAIYCYS